LKKKFTDSLATYSPFASQKECSTEVRPMVENGLDGCGENRSLIPPSFVLDRGYAYKPGP